ncbi:MAG: phosphonate C-P lyase system protein PhnH [Phyllobacterium sp.]|uniref:phosphonate C-P lyase system protein PhnH n=1 Tax=Phyllobacterium sp. TaxID=1871046 RepID=UPI0030EFEBCD
MSTAAQVFEGGFADAVLGSQQIFRGLMDAMAKPGLIVAVPELVAAPAPLTPVMASIAVTLFDHDATVWCDKSIASSEEAIGWLKFHTGLELVSEPAGAQFALVREIAAMPSFEIFARGTAEYPDRSTTIIMQVEGFDGSTTLTLNGPGIKDTQQFAPSRLPRMFIDQWAANRAAFPRGVDLVFAGRDTLAALPRTTRVATKED